MDKTTNNDLGSLFVVLSIVFSVTFLDWRLFVVLSVVLSVAFLDDGCL
jgi:hypothetical protein